MGIGMEIRFFFVRVVCLFVGWSIRLVLWADGWMDTWIHGYMDTWVDA